MSVLHKASRLKGSQTTTTKKQRTKPFAQPNFEYLKKMDPLSACQAELVIATAGIKMDGELNKKIQDMSLNDGKEGVGASI